MLAMPGWLTPPTTYCDALVTPVTKPAPVKQGVESNLTLHAPITSEAAGALIVIERVASELMVMPVIVAPPATPHEGADVELKMFIPIATCELFGTTIVELVTLVPVIALTFPVAPPVILSPRPTL